MKNYKDLTDADYLNKYYATKGEQRLQPFDTLADCLTYTEAEFYKNKLRIKPFAICFATNYYATMLFCEYDELQLKRYKKLLKQMFNIVCDCRRGKISKNDAIDYLMLEHTTSAVGVIPPFPWQIGD